MSLLFMDSFDHYGSANITTKWQNPGSLTGIPTIAAVGRHGSNGIRFVTGGNHGGNACARPCTQILTTASPTCIAGFSFNALTLPYAGYNISTTFDPLSNDCNCFFAVRLNTVTQVWFRINIDSTVSVHRGTTLLTTSAGTLPFGTPVYIEIKVTVDPTFGVVTMNVNGAPFISLTNVNTRNATTVGWNEVIIGTLISNNLTNGTWDYDDLYILDGLGAAPWNDFLGDVRVDARVATAPGATTGWTPSAGANWQNIDDSAPNDDTDYNSTTTLNAVDTFVVQDIPVAGSTVYGVQHNVYARKTDAGPGAAAPVIRHGGADFVGTNLPLPIGYTLIRQTHQTNPGTGIQWTEAGFNAAEFGYKKTI